MRLGPYELVRQIGAGGMGEVWAAHRASGPARDVMAVKRLPKQLAKDPTYRRILLEEARLSMLLRHKNIVHVFDAGEANGEAYIAMEFVHGLDLSRLRRLLDQTGEALTPTLIAHVIGQVLTGLAYAHNLEHDGELLTLVHRDVSPHNVMLSMRGEVKLTDFGVARLSTEDTSGTHVKGKARYMPPEQLRGESRSPTVDLFAVGAVLHEMLDGAVFRGDAKDDARLLGMAIDGVIPPPRRSLTSMGALEQLRRGLLEIDPRHRIQTAEDALALLRRWPGLKSATAEIADLVRRYLELAGSIDDPSPGGLGHQATALHENNDEIGLDEIDALANIGAPVDASFGDVAPESDLIGFGGVEADGDMEFQLEDEAPRTPAPKRQFVFDEAATAQAEPAPPRKRKKAPSTGSHQAFGQVEIAYDNAGPSLQVDLPPEHVRPSIEIDLPRDEAPRRPAARPTPPKPPRPWGRYVFAALAVGGIAAAVFTGAAKVAIDWAREVPLAWLRDHPIEIDSHEVGTQEPDEIGMRKARVIGSDRGAGYLGFRQRRMDLLASEDILYSFIPAKDADPLDALAKGEAEFALTTLDRLLLAHAGKGGAPGKVVAVVHVSLGGEALVLDNLEFPTVLSLVDAAAGLAEPPRALGYVAGTPSEHLDARLGRLLVSLDQVGLRHIGEFEDVQSVYDALITNSTTGTPVVAGWLNEPWVSKAVAAGMTVAMSTRDMPSASVHVLVASTHTLAERPELVDAVVAAYYQGIVAQKDLELISETARILGVSVEEAAQTHAGLCLFGAVGAEPWLVARGRPPLIMDAVNESWAALLHQARVTGASPQPDALLDARAMTAAAAGERKANTRIARPASLDACLEAASIGGSQGGGSPGVVLGEMQLPSSEPWFAERESALLDSTKDPIEKLAASLRAFNPATISAEVEAHGDGKRSLGQDRAEAVVAALQRAGAGVSLRARGSAKFEQGTGTIRIILTRAP